MPNSPIQDYSDLTPSDQTKVFALNPGDLIGWVDYPDDAATEAYVDGEVSDHNTDPTAHSGIAADVTTNAADISSLTDVVDDRSPAAGGTAGQVWGKLSGTDYDADWIDQTGAGGGGGTGGSMNQTVDLTDSDGDYGIYYKIYRDGTPTGTWPNRFEFLYERIATEFVRTSWFNEYGELRIASGQSNTIPLRLFQREQSSDAARDMGVPLFQIMDNRNDRNELMNIMPDGSINSPTTEKVVNSSDQTVVDMRVMTQAAYDGITPVATTFYIIVG